MDGPWETGSHEPVTPRIREAISSSAILVVAFSNGYLESPWCQQERELFIEAAGDVEKASSRFFFVHLDAIPRDRWPKIFSDDIGYQFYQKEFPVLLKPHHPAYQEVQELLRRTSSPFQPIWQSPITSHHQAGIISVAFSPDGQTLASGSWDNTIKLWEVDYVVNFHPNLADYLSRGWCKLDGRMLLWTDSTDNLYKSQMYEYMSVSPLSHIGILRRHRPQQELDEALFWQSLRATNLDSAMVLYERLTVPEVQESTRESLTSQLTRAAQTAFDYRMNAHAQWRLKQARSLVKPVETNHRVLAALKQMAELKQSLSQ